MSGLETYIVFHRRHDIAQPVFVGKFGNADFCDAFELFQGTQNGTRIVQSETGFQIDEIKMRES